jgi:hypothetical protein
MYRRRQPAWAYPLAVILVATLGYLAGPGAGPAAAAAPAPEPLRVPGSSLKSCWRREGRLDHKGAEDSSDEQHERQCRHAEKGE